MKNSDLLFGTRAVIEAVKSGREIDKIFVQKTLSNQLIKELQTVANDYSIPIQRVPPEKLNRISAKNHQGVIAFVSPIEFSSLDNIIDSCYRDAKEPFILILDRITDVRNFGAIARTAESAGVNAIVIPTKNTAAVNADAVKTSAGALNHISVCREPNLLATLKFIKNYGISTVAMTEKAEKSIFDSDLKGPIAIIMGSEEDGISTDLLKEVDYLLKIPMAGKVSSLNVSVSAAIGIFEIVRQRLSN